MKKLIYFLTCLSLIWANIEDYKVGTWNLQGSSSRTENKWNISVRQLITGESPVDVLMVQEAGSVPTTAQPTSRIQPPGTPVREYTWNLGTQSRPDMVYIYHADIDAGSRRVNLAIVSRTQAEEIVVVHQNTFQSPHTRPALGIRIGSDYFFNVHALASGGSDAPALVTAVHDHFNNIPNTTWLIAGDFNREPAALQASLDTRVTNNIRIINPHFATHAGATGSNRILDYAIVGRTSPTTTTPSLPALVALLMAASVRSYLASDHFPVRFGKFQ